ncbi:peptidase S8 [Thermococcus sp. M39]|uniref:S8 family peptidase n=1 Tax=unclassified Thermococcus TaxID=2627626 RepID=UPI00143A58CB|nr:MULTISPECIES: S8 family peptidase [unclassified Thermococcus]NJE08918.1 peptidase S8 [Thermococcus sp. M39]NJE12808.1 peptidase S8 [Thermococcus sp. LS2]
MNRREIISTLLIVLVVFSYVGVTMAEPVEKVRVIVTIDKSSFDERAIDDVGGQVKIRYKIISAVVVEIPKHAVKKLRAVRGVKKVEYDSEVYLLGKPSGVGKPKPPQPPQTIPWGIDRINASEAWNITTGESNGTIEVAILDTGIDYDHPDLADNIAWAVSVVRGKVSTNPALYKDRNGHGTHVAGTVAALNNDIGVVGAAPEVEIYAIKVLGNGIISSWSDLILGIEQALLGPDGVLDSDDDGIIVGDPDDDAAEVISMSLGGDAPPDALWDVIEAAYTYGVVLVAAAGNEGADNPSYPAAYPEVIAVGATDIEDQVPDWSNRNPEIAAPGVDVLSTYPDDTYATLSGTSMAAPHVSGVVALIQAVYYNNNGIVLPVGTEDDSTTDTVRGILHTTADDMGDSVLYGYGIVRADLAVQTASG